MDVLAALAANYEKRQEANGLSASKCAAITTTACGAPLLVLMWGNGVGLQS